MRRFFQIFFGVSALITPAGSATTDWSAGRGYRTLPETGCPSASQFGYKHFKQLKPLTVTGSASSRRIFRGGAPTLEGVKCLRQFGVNVIIDLRGESERGSLPAWAASQGAQYYSFPLATGSSPGSSACKRAKKTAAQCNQENVSAAIDRIERTLASDSTSKIYVHCARGEDRTGLALGLYRVIKERYPKATAYSEMKEYYYYPYEPLKAVWEKETAGYP